MNQYKKTWLLSYRFNSTQYSSAFLTLSIRVASLVSIRLFSSKVRHVMLQYLSEPCLVVFLTITRQQRAWTTTSSGENIDWELRGGGILLLPNLDRSRNTLTALQRRKYSNISQCMNYKGEKYFASHRSPRALNLFYC